MSRQLFLSLTVTHFAHQNSKSWRAAAGLLTEAHFRLIENGVLPRRGAVTHQVKSGDALSRIAAANHVPVDEIMTYNKLRSANHILISTRLKNPTWYTPDGRVYPYGDPGNVLGTRFLKLAAVGTPDKPLLGYGIHGTTREESVTRSESGGCIRMRNREVERLFELVPTGTPVEIVD